MHPSHNALPFVSLNAIPSFSDIWVCGFGTLAVLLLISGLDDMAPLAICLLHQLRRALRQGGRSRSAPPRLDPPESRIAIFVPCWKESAVIGNMVRQNLAAIRYHNYDFFLGAYPNDEATIGVVHHLAEGYANVHAAVCPHPGPTSKADCLNWIYRAMQAFENANGVRFETVVLHDAEDIIHPEALSLINRERLSYDMVQVPVLPLPTPFAESTHGIYCDEFAEYQTIDMNARQYSGSFVPSNGVGTGFARRILERLDRTRGIVFDAESLTEDYEIGVYIHDQGYRQLFAPLARSNGAFIATREYFPRTTNTAIRQRTRWITGITLQCWERRGWRGSFRTRYWFWRDRKGLITNPLSLLTNFLFLIGVLDLIDSVVMHRPWMFAIDNPNVAALCAGTLALQCLRLSLRMLWVARIFGVVFAMGVPLRSFHSNLINCFAAVRAVWRYFEARRSKRKLVWQKTEHAYPEHSALVQNRREFHEVLVSAGFISASALEEMRVGMPANADLGEYLFEKGLISDEDLCRAMSLHTGVASGRFDPRSVRRGVLQSLPAHVAQRFAIVPVEMHAGRLIVATPWELDQEALEAIRGFTSLAVEFQLTTRQNFLELVSAL